MLVLTRSPGQGIEIGYFSNHQAGKIVLGASRRKIALIRVLRLVNGQVRLGIEANAAHYYVYREECLPVQADFREKSHVK